MSLEYKVPRVLWENFEAVLLAHSKRYVCELAKHLQVPEKELLKKVIPSSDSVKVLMLDTQAESNQCHAFVQHDKITVFCRKPVIHGTQFCAFHRNKRMTVIEGTSPIQLQKVRDIPTINTMWINEEGSLVNSQGDIVGKVNKKESTLKIFVVDNA